MHPNPIYHTATETQNLDFARQRAFGTLTLAGPEGPLISHIPFILSEDGTRAEFHLVRSNPIVRALKEPQTAALAVTGPDSYISPDWYQLDDQVPTWNYVAVHLRGTAELCPADTLPDLLARQSAFYENQLLPKKPWTLDKMPDEALQRLLRMILPCRMQIASVDGTWKFSQNKPPEARQSAAGMAATYGIGSEIAMLAALMRGAPDSA